MNKDAMSISEDYFHDMAAHTDVVEEIAKKAASMAHYAMADITFAFEELKLPLSIEDRQKLFKALVLRKVSIEIQNLNG